MVPGMEYAHGLFAVGCIMGYTVRHTVGYILFGMQLQIYRSHRIKFFSIVSLEKQTILPMCIGISSQKIISHSPWCVIVCFFLLAPFQTIYYKK